MANKKNIWILYVIALGLALVIAALLFYMLPRRYKLNESVPFKETNQAFPNPYIGYAPNATSVQNCEDTSLVYIGLKWKDWEPEEGQYDVEYLESHYHIRKWKAENKHAVFRFQCDVPDKKDHMDIPEWLYEKTGDGVKYQTLMGKGYCPNYENPVFMQAHAKAIKALADYFNQDDFLIYVELGSIGFWGEWHADLDFGRNGMPDAKVCEDYVSVYANSFTQASLLMRRNYSMAVENEMGFFNDMLGELFDTKEWLEWQKNGDEQETSGANLSIVPVKKSWKSSPNGGEFTSSIPMERMLDHDLSKTVSMIRDCHVSFVGPKCPTKEEKELNGSSVVLRNIGYRYYVSEMNVLFSYIRNKLDFTLTWKNNGIAPIYRDIPVSVIVYDMDGKVLQETDLDLSLSQLMPGKEMTSKFSLPYTSTLNEGYQVGIKIANQDGRDCLQLAQSKQWKGNVQIIYVGGETATP